MDLLLGGSQPPKPAESWMKRNLKPLVAGVSVVVALALTLLQSGTSNQLGATPQDIRPGRPGQQDQKYDLPSLGIFSSVLNRVKENYVNANDFNQRQMLVASLNQVERTVPEVLVEETKKKVKVRVGSVQRSFPIGKINAVWHVRDRLREIMSFVQPNLRPETKVRDVEYAAVNGMLSTLDPHSLLLTPETYNEMKLSTRGHFGGLGIVISMVKGVLTVMNPMKDTPAARASIKACDQILKIEQESTVNMTLTQAVNRLRGTPGSKVEVTLMRPGWARPVRKVLTRAVIRVPSVSSRMLKKKVGYVRLKSFQGNSTREIREHLARLNSQGMRALVLDLRGNPGGLLDQAIRISDLFLESGTILTTVSHNGRNRDEKRAKPEGTERRYPMAVLVSSQSASASEIVAGALKNLDRAVIVGTRTFGKGTVQVLYDNKDGSALKLTIAEYLTPGDKSIQAVGITPDIHTTPMLVRKDLIRISRKDYSRREKDLRKHLAGRKFRKRIKSRETLAYLARSHEKEDQEEEEAERKTGNLCLYPDRECKPVDEDKFVLDFQIRMARDLVARARSYRRSQILDNAGAFFKQQEREQEQAITSALRKLGVDWTPTTPREGKPRIAVKLDTVPPQGHARACTPLKLKVTVTNTGDAPTSRLKAISESSNRLLKGHEFVFGRVDPGASRSWDVPVKVRDEHTRVDDMVLKFSEANGSAPQPFRYPIAFRGVDRPVFAYSYQLIDDIVGNKDGQPQRGETIRLLVKVRNTGKGRSLRTVTTLKNLSGEGIFLRKGRFTLGKMDPGESKAASFTFDLQRSFAMDKFKLELTVWDDGLREYTSEKLKFHVGGETEPLAAASGSVRINAGKAAFRAWASQGAPVVGHARRGAAFQVLGKTRAWYRVLAAPYRPAFLAARDVTPGGTPGKSAFVPRWQVYPPTLALKVPTYSTSDSQIKISGTVTDEERVLDVYGFVRNAKAKVETRKVFYISNSGSKSPRRLKFTATIPLWPGANYVSIFARESDDVQANATLVIYRRPDKLAAGKVMQSPRTKKTAR
jgi:carboxyl-terminal processing protease